MISASIEELGVELAEAIGHMPEAKKPELRKGWLAAAEAYVRSRWYRLHEIPDSKVRPWLRQFAVFVPFRPYGGLN